MSHTFFPQDSGAGEAWPHADIPHKELMSSHLCIYFCTELSELTHGMFLPHKGQRKFNILSKLLFFISSTSCLNLC